MNPFVAIAALAAGLAACREPPLPEKPLPPLVTRPHEPAPIPPRAGYAPGEHMTWKVSWRGLPIGRAQLVAARRRAPRSGPPGNAPALTLKSELRFGGMLGKKKGVVFRLTTEMDAGGAPLESRGKWPRPGHARRTRTRFTGEKYRTVLREGRPSPQVVTGGAPRPAKEALHDLHTALGSLRAWSAPKPSRRGFLYLVFSGRLYRVEVAAPSRAPGERGLRVPIRAARADRAGHHEAPLELVLHLSGDQPRALERIEIETERGQVVAELLD